MPRAILLFMINYWVVAVAVSLVGCTVTRPAQRFDARTVKAICVYDCRQQPDGSSGELYLKTISGTSELDEIVQILGRYEQGWTPWRTTEPVGILRIDYFDTATPDHNMQPATTQFRFWPSGVLTRIDGRPCWREMSTTDQQSLLRALGLESSFLENSHAGG